MNVKDSKVFTDEREAGGIEPREGCADMVEVVRCKDCKYYFSLLPALPPGCNNISGLLCPEEDEFCSRGEREEK